MFHVIINCSVKQNSILSKGNKYKVSKLNIHAQKDDFLIIRE